MHRGSHWRATLGGGTNDDRAARRASVFSQPVSSAVGGLVAAVVPNAMRGRTGGWSQAGILGGGVFAGGVAVWLSDRAASAVMATSRGADHHRAGVRAFSRVRRAARRRETRPHEASRDESCAKLVAMLKRRDVWLGLAFFLSADRRRRVDESLLRGRGRLSGDVETVVHHGGRRWRDC